mgnify:FL=1
MPRLSESCKHVLLIDDDPEEFDLFEISVAQANLPVSLRYANYCDIDKINQLPKPDFIFLDINMPMFDGFYWLQIIRKEVAEEIPIIIYSTTMNQQRVNLAYQLGANLFLSKPDTVDTLVEALQLILKIDWSSPRKVAEDSFAKDAFHLTF